jgi:hypothetical protein
MIRVTVSLVRHKVRHPTLSAPSKISRIDYEAAIIQQDGATAAEPAVRIR